MAKIVPLLKAIVWELRQRFLVPFSVFVRQKVIIIENVSFYRPCVRNPASGWLQIGHKLEKWQWCHIFLTWRHRQFFWRCRVFLIKFNYWSMFHVNIMTGSRVSTIFVYKGFTRNPENGKNLVWDWGKLVIPNFGMSLIKCY